MINPDRLTVKAAEALQEALQLARRNGNPLVYDGHLLAALLQQEEGIVAPVLRKLGVNVAELRARNEREIARYAKQSDAQPTISRELNQVLDRAESDAKALGDEFISTEHFLLALSDMKGTTSRELVPGQTELFVDCLLEGLDRLRTHDLLAVDERRRRSARAEPIGFDEIAIETSVERF